MKVKLTIEKTFYETRIIEMDEKFRQCACPIEDVEKVPSKLFEEAARSAAEITGLPLWGDAVDEDEFAKGFITSGECVDNGELVFEV